MSLPGSSWAILALTVLLCAAVSGQVFPAPAHLYPYGPGAGDTTAPAIDDGSSGQVPVSPPFPFFGAPYDSLYVSTRNCTYRLRFTNNTNCILGLLNLYYYNRYIKALLRIQEN